MTSAEPTVDRAPLLARVRGMDPVDLVPRATLALVLFNNRESLTLLVASGLLFFVAFFRRSLYASPYLWFGVTAVMGAWQAWHWERMDDHVVVTTYWTLALGLSLLASEPGRAMEINARRLVGLVFAFAVFWKVTSPDFLRGAFFHYTLLADDRFRFFAEHLGGLSSEAYDANTAAIATLYAAPEAIGHVALTSSAWLIALANLMTACGIATEATVALTFLAPLPERLWGIRFAALLVFCLTTYAMVPVAGFALLLLTLGLAQTRPGWRSRMVFAVALPVMYLYPLVWRPLFYG